jgi:hypothetical protein
MIGSYKKHVSELLVLVGTGNPARWSLMDKVTFLLHQTGICETNDVQYSDIAPYCHSIMSFLSQGEWVEIERRAAQTAQICLNRCAPYE